MTPFRIFKDILVRKNFVFTLHSLGIFRVMSPCFLTSTGEAKNYDGRWDWGCFHKTSRRRLTEKFTALHNANIAATLVKKVQKLILHG